MVLCINTTSPFSAETTTTTSQSSSNLKATSKPLLNIPHSLEDRLERDSFDTEQHPSCLYGNQVTAAQSHPPPPDPHHLHGNATSSFYGSAKILFSRFHKIIVVQDSIWHLYYRCPFSNVNLLLLPQSGKGDHQSGFLSFATFCARKGGLCKGFGNSLARSQDKGSERLR
ncbi:hypothetical protein CEXT_547611 [Caerostris extrusa]|uniref:Uncharacterized protein n=1 Tax=Caerostris extrusa TaxID=172846 RepID=A0AAV4N2L3_CAEEX|nr:hypothetical protein CEXT_547611 [Caerostris extrusa]